MRSSLAHISNRNTKRTGKSVLFALSKAKMKIKLRAAVFPGELLPTLSVSADD